MRDILAAIIIGLIVFAVTSPEKVGAWLQQIDNVRYSNTMFE